MIKRKDLKIHIGKWSAIFIALSAALIALDLLTKFLEERFSWNFDVIPYLIRVRSGTHNPGCAFSFLNKHPEVGQPILISFTSILLLAIITIFLFVPEKYKFSKLSLSIISAGAIGNLVDRCATVAQNGAASGYVRDFIELNMFGWVSCNIADFCIVIGTVMIMIDILFINDWAIFPLTKSAKAAQAKRKEKEDGEMQKLKSEAEKSEDCPQDADQKSENVDGRGQDDGGQPEQPEQPEQPPDKE